MENIILTRDDLVWLNSRGGRTSQDVQKDLVGLYVLMYDGNGGDTKVYLPNTTLI